MRRNVLSIVLTIMIGSTLCGCDWFDDEPKKAEVIEQPKITEAPKEADSTISTDTPKESDLNTSTDTPVIREEPSNLEKDNVEKLDESNVPTIQDATVSPSTITPIVEVKSKDSILETIPSNYDVNYLDYLNDELIAKINDYREQHNLNRLMKSNDLMLSSKYKSLSEAQRNYIDHTNPEFEYKGAGYLLWNIFNINSDGYGENLIKSYYDSDTPPLSADELFNLWKNSPGHNKIMLKEWATKIGISNVSVDYGNIPYAGAITLYTTMHITD